MRASRIGYVYVIRVNGYCKIGKTKNYEKGFGEYTKLMEEPEIIAAKKVEFFDEVEKMLQEKYKRKRTNGEWFILSDCDISEIKNILESV